MKKENICSKCGSKDCKEVVVEEDGIIPFGIFADTYYYIKCNKCGHTKEKKEV